MHGSCDQEESVLFFMEALALIRLKKMGFNSHWWYSRKNGGRDHGVYKESGRKGYSRLKDNLTETTEFQDI